MIEPLIEIHTPLFVLRNVNLGEVAVGVAPKEGSPGGIQRINGFVSVLQPIAEPLLGIRIVIKKDPRLIVHLPANNPWILAIMPGQLLNHLE